MGLSSPFLVCELNLETWFYPRVSGIGNRITWQWKGLADTSLTRRSRLTWPVISHVDIINPDIMQQERDVTSENSPKNPQLLSNHERTNNPRLRNFLQNTWPVIFKIVKVMKNKERQRNCHRLKGLCQINAMWYTEWSPRNQKKH